MTSWSRLLCEEISSNVKRSPFKLEALKVHTTYYLELIQYIVGREAISHFSPKSPLTTFAD